ncbi:MAG: hypothetical protein NZ888_03375 [Candidatus Nitrosocaldus sp.]|nr:hypothetical protein [Candidatus Nitrosocaldus sp.]MDW8000184.1 hypothetical protein [Candidatus Nitrosocaldus sp.]
MAMHDNMHNNDDGISRSPSKPMAPKRSLLLLLISGTISGLASALYLYINSEPYAIQLAVHALILISGYIVYKMKIYTATKGIALYMACALPSHLAIHILLIGDITTALSTP